MCIICIREIVYFSNSQTSELVELILHRQGNVSQILKLMNEIQPSIELSIEESTLLEELFVFKVKKVFIKHMAIYYNSHFDNVYPLPKTCTRRASVALFPVILNGKKD